VAQRFTHSANGKTTSPPLKKGGQGGFALQIVDGATLMQRLIRIERSRMVYHWLNVANALPDRNNKTEYQSGFSTAGE
jgi:hypothetical protein